MDRRTLAEVTGRPVLGSVSRMLTRKRRWLLGGEVAGVAGALACLVVVVAASVIFSDQGSHMFQSFVDRLLT
jgi:hypothetical protein